MTREEAIHRLKNTAWLGTNKDREETEQAVDMAIEALSADRPNGEWEFVDNEIFAGEYFCSVCGKRAEVDLYGEWILSNFCPMCGAEMADNSLVNNITESPNDVIESQDDVIKKPRTVRYKLHKPIEYVSIEFDEEEEITQIGHYTAYGERREP